MNRFLSGIAGSILILVSCTPEPLLAQQSAPGTSSTQQAPSTATPVQQAPASPSTMQPPPELPENPGSTVNQQNTAPAQPRRANNSQQQPSGTAVAPPVELSGGAASKPAGVAIAPPKQRQIRSLLIKFGFLVGAGAAIGTVVALSAASPGHVPNSPGH